MILIEDRGYEIRALLDDSKVELECVVCKEKTGKKMHSKQKFVLYRNTKGLFVRRGNKRCYITKEVEAFMEQFKFDKEKYKEAMKKEKWY